jgi:dipicolinate synthase subunit B
MSYIGHPVVGDPLYGPRKVIGNNGQYLHAKTIGFVHPTTNEYMEFDSEIPEDFVEKIENITGRKIISSIREAEPIGPKNLLDMMIIAPCTGNTASKLANGITDSGVTMAAKANLRNENPLVIAISTNDGLGASAKNIGLLLNTRNVYFVPFTQDDPEKKHTSLVARMEMIVPTLISAADGEQIQPVLFR